MVNLLSFRPPPANIERVLNLQVLFLYQDDCMFLLQYVKVVNYVNR